MKSYHGVTMSNLKLLTNRWNINLLKSMAPKPGINIKTTRRLNFHPKQLHRWALTITCNYQLGEIIKMQGEISRLPNIRYVVQWTFSKKKKWRKIQCWMTRSLTKLRVYKPMIKQKVSKTLFNCNAYKWRQVRKRRWK